MTITEILGLVFTSLSLLGGAYAFIRRVDIREENALQHKEFDERLEEGREEFSAIRSQLNNLVIEVNNVKTQFTQQQQTHTELLTSIAKVLDKQEKLLIDNARIKAKLGIE